MDPGRKTVGARAAHYLGMERCKVQESIQHSLPGPFSSFGLCLGSERSTHKRKRSRGRTALIVSRIRERASHLFPLMWRTVRAFAFGVKSNSRLVCPWFSYFDFVCSQLPLVLDLSALILSAPPVCLLYK